MSENKRERERERCSCTCIPPFHLMIFLLSAMYENTDTSILSPSRSLYQYESVPSRSFYENHTPQPTYISFELNSPSISKEPSIVPSLTPPFQKKLPIIPVAILGLFEILSGLIVLVLEILIFDIAIGLWCGFIYLLAGMAAIVLVIGTDRERHQTSAVLIFQFVALMFSITEIILHTDTYQKRCMTKATEPSRDSSYQCQILLIQISGAAFTLLNTLLFVIIYIRITILVLKQPHGTFNLSKAMNLTC